jgi:RNA polymerase sigma-70 factor (ECF subfamily)
MEVIEYNRSVDAYSDHIFRYILKQINDDELAKDIVQESYIKLWERVDQIHYDKAKAWLFKTAYRTMIDMIRKRKYESKAMAPEHPSHNDQYSDLKYWLDKGLETLPENQRAAILLRDYEGYSYEEIGEILDLSESQVKVYIYRGRVALKKFIGNPHILA